MLGGVGGYEVDATALHLLVGVGADADGIEGPDVEQAVAVGAGDDEVLARGRTPAVPPGHQSQVIPIEAAGQAEDLAPLGIAQDMRGRSAR